MKREQLAKLLTGLETPTVEFKSDTGPLTDAELVEAVVCLANAPGWDLVNRR